MQIEETDFTNYKQLVHPRIFYNEADFNSLNQDKVECVRYFLFKDKKYRFALCVGEKDKMFRIPFSAPFSSFVPIRKKWDLLYLDEAIKCFDEFAKSESAQSIHFTLPPSIYDETLISSIQNCLLRRGYTVCQQELNFSILLGSDDDTYIKKLPLNGRNTLNESVRRNALKIRHCTTSDNKRIAYDIIAQNHKWKGYPLRMSWDQVAETIQIVSHDFFIVSHDERNIAAAVVFQVTKDIAQVIYWGNIPGVSEFRPMNFLAFRLMQYYRDKGMKYLDIGPSTENGVPNYGLCDFKRSIGCEVSAKFVLEKIL